MKISAPVVYCWLGRCSTEWSGRAGHLRKPWQQANADTSGRNRANGHGARPNSYECDIPLERILAVG